MLSITPGKPDDWRALERTLPAWAAENGLNLLNTADVPTNPHGNTIDLAFSNIALASAVVEDHLATSSDHFTLSVILPDVSLSLPQTPGKVRVTTEEELERFKELVAAGACRIPTDTATASQLDTLAAALVDLLQSAARAAGRTVRKGTRSAPWWTDECAEAAAEYRAIRRILPLGFSQEVQLARESSSVWSAEPSGSTGATSLTASRIAHRSIRQSGGSNHQEPSSLHRFKLVTMYMKPRLTKRMR